MDGLAIRITAIVISFVFTISFLATVTLNETGKLSGDIRFAVATHNKIAEPQNCHTSLAPIECAETRIMRDGGCDALIKQQSDDLCVVYVLHIASVVFSVMMISLMSKSVKKISKRFNLLI